MIPRAAAAVALLSRAGYRVLVCSNQACVGRGELAIDELARINAEIDAGVRAAGGVIDQWYICPHRADEDCDCRKPKPGLLLQAQADHGFELAATWFIGDAARDCQAAAAASCQAIWCAPARAAPPARNYRRCQPLTISIRQLKRCCPLQIMTGAFAAPPMIGDHARCRNIF